jgi:tRNA pseudouridine65 synthase
MAPRELGILEICEAQLAGQKLYPVHRLDRATSGVLLMARNRESASCLSRAFQEHRILKTYIALVRGWCHDEGEISKPLARSERHDPQPALTRYRTLHRIEIPQGISRRHPTTRYSLVEAHPETGRHHQIRRHFASISHPLIGDTVYGEGRHNRFFREHYGFQALGLHALQLGVPDSQPGSQQAWVAPIPKNWEPFLTPWGITRGLHKSEEISA